MKKETRTQICFPESVINKLNETLEKRRTSLEVSLGVSVLYNVYGLTANVYDNGDEIIDVDFSSKGQFYETGSLDFCFDVSNGHQGERNNSKDAVARMHKMYMDVFSAFCGKLHHFISIGDNGPAFDLDGFLAFTEKA